MKELYSLVLLLACVGAFSSAPQAKTPSESSAFASTLPAPSGSYATGTAIYQLTDTSRKDRIANERSREVVIQVWYPARSIKGARNASYIPDARIIPTLKAEKYLSLDEQVIDGWTSIRTNSALDAPISGKRSKYPLLFISPGRGSLRSHYTMLSEELASRGYIVVSIDHPYTAVMALSDGRIVSSSQDPRSKSASSDTIAELARDGSRDVSFVLDQLDSGERSDPARRFSKRFDVERIGMLGHSLGGLSAMDVCGTDVRFKACANLDAFLQGKELRRARETPLLFIRSNPVYSDEDLVRRRLTREQWDRTFNGFKALFEAMLPKQKDIPAYIVTIKGTEHISFNDAPFVMPDKIIGKKGHIDHARGFMILSSYVCRFFDKYLNGEKKNLLDETGSPYPEVSIEKYNVKPVTNTYE